MSTTVSSVLWCYWLGGRNGIWPVKTEWWDAGVVICLGQGADLHMAQMMPLPLTVFCFSKIQIDFAFLVLAHTCNPGQRAIKHVLLLLLFKMSTNCSNRQLKSVVKWYDSLISEFLWQMISYIWQTSLQLSGIGHLWHISDIVSISALHRIPGNPLDFDLVNFLLLLHQNRNFTYLFTHKNVL